MITKENAKQMVGQGWSGLIEGIYSFLPESAIVGDVKEKFGGLRFYVYNIDDLADDKIDGILTASNHICEMCGAEGKHVSVHGWTKTLCAKHKEELNAT